MVKEITVEKDDKQFTITESDISATLEYGIMHGGGLWEFSLATLFSAPLLLTIIAIALFMSGEKIGMSIIIIAIGIIFLAIAILLFAITMKQKKKIRLWMDDAVLIKGETVSVQPSADDRGSLKLSAGATVLNVRFKYNGSEYEHSSADAKLGGRSAIFNDYAFREIYALYSPKYDRLLLLNMYAESVIAFELENKVLVQTGIGESEEALPDGQEGAGEIVPAVIERPYSNPKPKLISMIVFYALSAVFAVAIFLPLMLGIVQPVKESDAPEYAATVKSIEDDGSMATIRFEEYNWCVTLDSGSIKLGLYDEIDLTDRLKSIMPGDKLYVRVLPLEVKMKPGFPDGADNNSEYTAVSIRAEDKYYWTLDEHNKYWQMNSVMVMVIAFILMGAALAVAIMSTKRYKWAKHCKPVFEQSPTPPETDGEERQ